ncbi:TPA: hypothetical protein DDW35_12645 [Candidatus Sumerlaeota bacterium]|nr:hypothetical protein [Candidatus Sumerlaeota bacterium]
MAHGFKMSGEARGNNNSIVEPIIQRATSLRKLIFDEDEKHSLATFHLNFLNICFTLAKK